MHTEKRMKINLHALPLRPTIGYYITYIYDGNRDVSCPLDTENLVFFEFKLSLLTKNHCHLSTDYWVKARRVWRKI